MTNERGEVIGTVTSVERTPADNEGEVGWAISVEFLPGMADPDTYADLSIYGQDLDPS